MKTKQKQIKKPTTARTKVSKPVSSRSKVVSVRKPAVRSRVVAKKATTRKKVDHKKVRRTTKKILIPNKANEYRPHLIRAHGLVAVLVVALMAQVVYSFITTGNLSVLGRASDIPVANLLVDTNEKRAAEGLGELKMNKQLSEAALLKAQNMFDEQYWAHTSPSGIEPWKWFADVNYGYSTAGENLAKNYPTSEATVNAWMNSDSHRDNILNSRYVDVGFAVVNGLLQGKNTTLVVALYGAPATVSAVVLPTDENQQKPAPFLAASVAGETSNNPLAYFGSAVQSLSPVTIIILGVLGIVAIVGVVAHHNRAKLPRSWRRNWKMNHGFYTFVGMITLGILIIIATGGGQI